VDTPKSEAGERTIALDDASPLPAAFFEHRGRSFYSGNDDRVFTSQTGAPFDPARYAVTFRLALKKAGIRAAIRPFQDLRHTAITNDAASGMSPEALMTKHGHSSFKTTQGYIDLAGETFREEAKRAAERKFAHVTRESEALQ
jgi:site-specific recombinase XerD